jgi:hypothetical protein
MSCLIVAAYTENISWVNTVAHAMQVFVFLASESIVPSNLDHGVRVLHTDNYATEVSKYLHFIVSFYNTLNVMCPQHIIFSQGDPFTHNLNFVPMILHTQHLWKNFQCLSANHRNHHWQYLTNVGHKHYRKLGSNYILDLGYIKDDWSSNTWKDPWISCNITQKKRLCPKVTVSEFLGIILKKSGSVQFTNKPLCLFGIFATNVHSIKHYSLSTWIHFYKIIKKNPRTYGYLFERLWGVLL